MKTKLRLTDSPSYRAVLRTVQILPVFDRILISVIHHIPFGTTSRILTEFESEGYIERTGEKATYNRRELMQNEEISDMRLNYGKLLAAKKSSVSLRKTDTFLQLLMRWNGFRAGKPAKAVKGPFKRPSKPAKLKPVVFAKTPSRAKTHAPPQLPILFPWGKRDDD